MGLANPGAQSKPRFKTQRGCRKHDLANQRTTPQDLAPTVPLLSQWNDSDTWIYSNLNELKTIDCRLDKIRDYYLRTECAVCNRNPRRDRPLG